MKEKIKDILWAIQSFIRQPIVPTVSMQYIISNDCSYIANNPMKNKYVYYWKGDIKKGKTVKVKALDHLRHDFRDIELENEFLSADKRNLEYTTKEWEKKLEKVIKVETHDLGETFVKNEIIKILKGELEDDYENEI